MHSFYIPVMGTGFTIDTAVHVAPLGVSSVLSLVDDQLIEQMREHHCKQSGREYQKIEASAEDCRAQRITAYLDLLDDLVEERFSKLVSQSLDSDGELAYYFSLLPSGEMRDEAKAITELPDGDEKISRLTSLKEKMKRGSIDVNIMTKLNRTTYQHGEEMAPEFSDALSALRGLAKAKGSFSVVFSAGMNAGLYSYLTKFKDFFPTKSGDFQKKVILKVSDYRSALIQGKFLAKRGIWISEYRIESGLNCGGHAFATQGALLGPVLEEFKEKRTELTEFLKPVYLKALEKLEKELPEQDALNFLLTVQGGVGVAGEAEFLSKRYGVDLVGWGTPFLLVPEVIRIDEEHIEKLKIAEKSDVKLSKASPLGVDFWNLMNSASELKREERIREGKPGSPCPKGYIKLNTDYTKKPICRASRGYQKAHLKNIEARTDLPDEQIAYLKNLATSRSCICHDLAGGATKSLGIDIEALPAICCGPNIVNFSKKVSFSEMVNHINGRESTVEIKSGRQHQLIAEANLYLDNLVEEIKAFRLDAGTRDFKYLKTYSDNFQSGLRYYLELFKDSPLLADAKESSIEWLQGCLTELEGICMEFSEGK